MKILVKGIAVAIATVGLAIGVWFYLEGRSVGAAPLPTSIAASRPLEATKPAISDLDLSRPLPQRLPPVESRKDVAAALLQAEPLTTRFADLADRAQKGDKKAACQLSSDLDLCWRIPAMRKYILEMEQQAASRSAEQSDEFLPGIAALEQDIERGQTVCVGLTDQQLASAWRHQLRAAELGDADAGYRFLTSPPLDHQRFADNMEGWAEYLRNFRPLLERLVAAGHIPSTYFAQGLYAGTDRVGVVTTQPIEPDLYRATVLAHVLMNSADASVRAMVDSITLRRASEELTPAAQLRATQEARALMGTSFQHSDFSRFRSSWETLAARSAEDC